MLKLSVYLLKLVFILCACTNLAFAGKAKTAAPSLSKLWQSEAVLKVPESVRYDAVRKVLYTSNVDGKKPWDNDGKGSIGKLNLDGSVIDAEWVTGLNGPKGMGLLGNYLYVTDIDDVVTIDIAQGKVVERIEVPDAGHINDLSVAKNGTVYITDSMKGDIYTLINGKLTKILSGIKALNGVLHSEGELAYLSDGAMYILAANGKAKMIGKGFEGGADGVERVSKDTWLVSTWAGVVYHVTRDGSVTQLLDGRPSGVNAADLGYDPVNKIAYFAGFWNNFITAYKLNL